MSEIMYETPSGTTTEEIGEDRGLEYNKSLDAWTIVYDEQNEDKSNDYRTKIIPDHRVYEVDIPYTAETLTD